MFPQPPGEKHRASRSLACHPERIRTRAQIAPVILSAAQRSRRIFPSPLAQRLFRIAEPRPRRSTSSHFNLVILSERSAVEGSCRLPSYCVRFLRSPVLPRGRNTRQDGRFRVGADALGGPFFSSRKTTERAAEGDRPYPLVTHTTCHSERSAAQSKNLILSLCRL